MTRATLRGAQRPVTADTCPLSSRSWGGGGGVQSITLRAPQSSEAADRGGPALRRRPAPPAAGSPLQPASLRLAAPGLHLARKLRRSERAAGGRGRGGAAGAGGGAAGCLRAPPRLRAPSRRPGVPVQPLPPMGEVEPGPAGPLEPPEPPEAPASRRPGGIRVLKVRRADKRVAAGAEAGSGRPCLARWPRRPATPASRQSVRPSVRGAARPPRSPA